MKKHIIYWLALGLAVIIGCQKELSFEVGNTPGNGSLQSDTSGDCLPKTVNGIYAAGTPLIPATNTITVQVNVTQTGTYEINTDTVNGFFFRTTGTFTTLGANTVTLRSNGTPFAAGINNFVVSYDSTFCDIQVTVLPAGAGAAVFTLAGSPSCTTPVIAGTYATSIALNASNTVTLNVNVITAGTYNVSTAPAVGGMIFSGTGSLLTGPQTIVLTGGGTPTLGGNNTIPVTVGASTCSFVINVVSGAVGTLDGGPAPGTCTPITVNGTYTVGTALTATNTVQIRIDVTTAGTYSITASSGTAGFGFAKSGTVAVGIDQLITLDFTGGPPTTAGVHTFTVTFGTSTCTFTITVGGATGAVGTLDGSPACAPITVNGTYTVGTPLTATNTAQVRIDVTTAGAYTITATSGTAGFGFSKSGTVAVGIDQLITLDFTGGPPTTAGVHTFTVTFGTSTCTFTVTVQPALSNDYFPRTTNSNWSYEIDNDPNDSLYRNVIANTLFATGNTYNIFMQNDGIIPPPDSSGYFRKNGGDYFEWFDAGAFFQYTPPPLWAEYTFLKDNVAAGTSWTSQGFSGTINFPPPTPFTLRFKYSILQKDVPVTITTSIGPPVNYLNVIVVEEKYEQFTGGIWVDITSVVGSGKSYYARGIGLIKFEAFDGTGTLSIQLELRRFQIF